MRKPSKVGVVLASFPFILLLFLCLWIIWKINDGKEAASGEGLIEMILTFYAMFASLVVYGVYILVRWFRCPKSDMFYPCARKMAIGPWGSALAIFLLSIFSYELISRAPYDSFLGALLIYHSAFVFGLFLLVLPLICSVLELLFYLKRKKDWKENTPASL